MVKAGMARIEADVAILKAAYGDLTADLEDNRRALAARVRPQGFGEGPRRASAIAFSASGAITA
jgi:hypothetical protein